MLRKPTQTPQAQLKELEELLEIEASLPHIRGFPWYKWAKKFHDSTNKANFLCAANQVSKSSTQIRRAIHHATEPSLWPQLWPGLLPGQTPNQFWYFYPTFEVWQTEFETKWEPDFLPRNKMKDHPQYGWKEYYAKGQIKKIEFNSGVTIYCKAYSQKIKDLQSGSVHEIFLDEECPDYFMPELQARLRATNGPINAVFTATLGQEYWRRTMEPKNPDEEIYPDALKLSISLYDSQEYIDKKKSRWTDKRIKQIINECGTEAEVQRRVFGRFVKSEGLKFESFDIDRNTIEPTKIPANWHVYSGVDPGSGGKSGHPAAMLFLAIRPDYKLGIPIKAKRMDGIPTANTDIVTEYRNLKRGLNPIIQLYDYKDKDFYLVAQSQGENFQMANKSREEGIGLLNSLFKNAMIKIPRGDTEMEKLITELSSLTANEDKRKAKDDLADCLRYIAMEIPWDFQDLNQSNYQEPAPDQRTDEQRKIDEIMQGRRNFTLNKDEHNDDIANEFDYWNDLAGTND